MCREHAGIMDAKCIDYAKVNMECAWIMQGLSMEYAWIMQGLCMEYVWTMQGLCMEYAYIYIYMHRL
jgi:hypothetical protein